MLNLVLVSAGTIVTRDFEETNQEYIREIAFDAEMMRQVLVLDGDNVIFEFARKKDGKRPTPNQVRDILKAKEVKRRLTAREKLALSKVCYKVKGE